jgi:hypothetical protein
LLFRSLPLITLLAAAPVAAQTIVTPSGQSVTLFDVVIEPDTNLARFRFLAPQIGDGVGFDVVQDDFPWLCANVALPALAANDWAPGQIIVSLSDREIALGASDPDAVQFFEGFRIDGDTCIWEAY